MALPTWTCACGERNTGPSPCSRCLSPAPLPSDEAPIIGAPSRSHRWMAPLVILVAVLLLAGGLAIAIVGGGRGEGSDPIETADAARIEATTAGADTEGLVGVPLAIAQAIPQLMQFVENARGLTFEEPVVVTLLPDREFREAFAALQAGDEDAEERSEDLRVSGRVFRALGLVDGPVDLEKALD